MNRRSAALATGTLAAGIALGAVGHAVLGPDEAPSAAATSITTPPATDGTPTSSASTATVTTQAPTTPAPTTQPVKTPQISVTESEALPSTTTATHSPEPAPSTTAPTSEAEPPAPDFDRAWAIAKARNVVEDIRSTDERIADGDYYSASSSLWLLADSFGRVRDAGPPPGVDAGTYLVRLQTLESFASQASNEIADSPLQGSARYAVLRKETGVILTQLTAATGVTLQLP